jgi:hypothetical protein
MATIEKVVAAVAGILAFVLLGCALVWLLDLVRGPRNPGD